MSVSEYYQLASEIKARWRNGATPDAHVALTQYPELAMAKSLAVDLAYEEYCQRTSAGEDLDVDAFCHRFSRFRASLHKRLEVHDFLEVNSDLLDDLGCDAWPEPGDCICGFRLLEELGRGAIGRVFLAEELALADRQVVIKLTRAGVREGETLSRLKHEHIVPIYSIHAEEMSGLTAICMPFLSRWTLQDFLDAAFAEASSPRRFSHALGALLNREPSGWKGDAASREATSESYIDGILKLLIKLCDALAHTHQREILHLDLKPSNILITPDGEPLLLDFNLSIAGATRSSLVGGTMPYMSPEQIQSLVLPSKVGGIAVDHRSDIFSLGVIGYQLLTGKYPFLRLLWKQPSVEVGRDLLALQQAEASPAHQVDPRIDAVISRVLSRAMHYDVERRYASADEFARELRNLLSTRGRAKRYALTHRREFLALGGFGLLTAGLAVGAYARHESAIDQELRLGWEYFQAGENEAALKCFQHVVDQKPTLPEGWFAVGRAHQRLGKFDLAHNDFEQAHKLRPDGIYRACQGFCLVAEKQYGTANRRLSEAISEGFVTENVLRLRGKCFKLLDDELAAERFFRAAKEINPDYSQARYDIALLIMNQPGRRVEASECCEQALRCSDATVEMSVSTIALARQARQELPDWKSQVRPAIKRGLELGLVFQDIEPYEFLKEFWSDPLFAQIPRRPAPANRPIPITDPLGDREISRSSFPRTR